MKLLFCGPLKDFSGFATASRNFLRALTFTDLDLTARAIVYDKLDSKDQFEVPYWLQSLLEKDINNVDACLQMTTCNIEAQPIPGVMNGLYTFLESDRMQPSWVAKANEFDFLVVACKHNAEAMARSGVTKPIMICAPPCNQEDYKKVSVDGVFPDLKGRTVFYNICQLSAKKGIDSLLRAYFAAFADKPDRVILVLKTYINMQDRSQDMDQIKAFIQHVKNECRLPVKEHPPVMIINETMSFEDIAKLHQSCDVYVCSSRAEGWGIPVFDALCHGNTVISHSQTGLEGFIRDDNALIYQTMPTTFFGMHHSDRGLFTGLEQCVEPCIPHMSQLMRRYEEVSTQQFRTEEVDKEWQSVLKRRENGKSLAARFDGAAVGNKISDQIVSAYENWSKNGTVSFNTGNIKV